MTTVGEYADEIMAQVHADAERSFPWGKTIPADVGSFSELHEYCDANCYLLDAVPQGTLDWDVYMALCNAVSDEVDRRLAAEAIALDTGQRCPCGRLARFNSGHVVHIDDRSHQCEPCDFCLYPVCHRPLEDRGPFDGRLPSSGVTAGHEGFGTALMCEQGHWWTWIQGGLIGADRILTVIEKGELCRPTTCGRSWCTPWTPRSTPRASAAP
jgi:hypothetical protein